MPKSGGAVNGFAGKLDALGLVDFHGRGVRRMAAVTSFGRSTRTGPGRPEVAILKGLVYSPRELSNVLDHDVPLCAAREMPMTSAS
jgi:hypothetical protein